MTRTYPRANTTARGLGHPHRQLRALLLPAAYGKPCPMCGHVMADPRICDCGGKRCRWCTLDLDHEIPRALGGGGRSRITHRYCNRAAGAKLGNRLRHQARNLTSRRW